MKKNHIIPALLCAIALAGCSRKVEQPGNLLTFDVAVEAEDLPMSKAMGQIGDVSGIHSGIGVFACNTGRYRYADSNANPDFMYNEKVYYNAGHWTYDIPKYWPEDYVSFFAYAPYSDGSDVCITSFSDQDDTGNPWLTYQLSANVDDQVDLLYAVALTDQTREATSGNKLQFTFKHALACVGEKVTVACSSALKTALDNEVSTTSVDRIRVLLNSASVTYHLTAKARLVLWNNGEANWQPILNGEIMTNRTVTYLATGGDSDVVYDTSTPSGPGWTSAGNQGVFYIPLDVAGNFQSADITLEYTIERTQDATTSTSTTPATNTLQLRSNPSFAPGKKIALVAILTGD